MSKTVSKTGITTGNTIRAWHVTQSIDALNGTDAYDITISGSLTVTSSVSATSFTGSFSSSFHGDGSDLTGIVSASYAATVTSASHASTAVSASYAPSSGTDLNLSGTLVNGADTSGSNITVSFGDSVRWNDSGFVNRIITNTLTSNKTQTIQDKTGTIAHLDDVSAITGSSRNVGEAASDPSILSTDSIIFYASTIGIGGGSLNLPTTTPTGSAISFILSTGSLAASLAASGGALINSSASVALPTNMHSRTVATYDGTNWHATSGNVL